MSGHSRKGSTSSGGSRKSISGSTTTSPTTSTSRIPAPSQSTSLSPSTRKQRESLLTGTENSLNPILRINKAGAVVSAATSPSTATATSLTQTQTPPSASKKSAERSRCVSTSAESLRKNIAAAAKGRPASPAPSSSSRNGSSLEASPTVPPISKANATESGQLQRPDSRVDARAASASSPSRLPGPASSIKRSHTPPALPSLIRRSSGSSSSLSSIAHASPAHSPHQRQSQFQTPHPRSPSNTASTSSTATASFNLIHPSVPTMAIVQMDPFPSYNVDDAPTQTNRMGASTSTTSAAATDNSTPASPQTGSRSIDYLKSSLRDTLNSDGQARRRKASDASSHSASIARRKKRRSVSFAVDPALEGVGGVSKRPEVPLQGGARKAPGDESGTDDAALDAGASAAAGSGRPSGASGIVSDIADGSSKKTILPTSSPTASASTLASPSASAASPDASVSSAVSSLSCSASRPRRRLSYPELKDWEPLSPESGDITVEEREHLAGPLQLAKSLFSNFDERRTSSSTSVDSAEVRQISQQLRRRTAGASSAVLVPWWNRGQLAVVHQLVETVVGVFLAVAWLALGKVIGAKHIRTE